MLSVIGSLLGFASSTAPAIADHFKNKSNQKFELEKMKVAAELRKQGYDFELKAHEAQAQDKEHERLVQHDISINQGAGFISALQKSVRPVITYCFFGLFLAIEITLLREALKSGMEVAEALMVLWDEDTKAIFAAIISFWFGSRAIEKAKRPT